MLSLTTMSIALSRSMPSISFFFFFNDTATTEIYTLSLHDALPIYAGALLESSGDIDGEALGAVHVVTAQALSRDRKSTRLNSSHQIISYAVFCLKKKKKNQMTDVLNLD